ncbi:glutathione S-transferase family protein [Falsiroseomonas oryzae]|uniref:glutathione S-transferase family protein n=1 Tax=Falsiroseomonas oryzae TaxID=2766473 RepID=UPI0022EB2E8E|nr:glutathione S-transferase N-terminal domain-containing protein [Roseomonas sp. MO-31]
MSQPGGTPVLWTSTFTSGTLAHQVAAISGVPFELRFISLRAGDHKAPAYLALNPKGEVPALQLPDGTVVTELPAIIQWFGEAAPDSFLLPQAGTPRIKAIEWLAWCHWSMGRHFNPCFAALRFADGDEQAATAVRSAALKRCRAALDFAEAALAAQGGTLLDTEHPTAPDIFLATLGGFAGFLKLDIGDLPALNALMRRVAALPAVTAALAREKAHA